MASHTLRRMTALGFGIPMLFAGIAFAQCGAPNTSDCCYSSQFPGCSDAACCTTVCALDPCCCDSGWDILCAAKANVLCESCPGFTNCGAPNANDCCSAGITPGCSDATCCETICLMDPFCCVTRWDSVCAQLANQNCDPSACSGVVCGQPSANDCCAPSTTPGCNDAACCETICTFDFSCCDTAWDANCAQRAIKSCQICIGWGGGGCGETSPNDCCSTSVFPGCSDEVCCEAVCAVDPYCCIDAWTQPCAEQALQLCAGCDDICGAPNATDCCTPSQTPGCSDGACCETVCAVDPSCCDQDWDMDCVNAAKTMCEACGASPCTGDVTGDGTVDGSDLAAVLVAWGSNGQGELDADLNDDGTVDGSDLTFVLVGWGPCP